MRKVRNAGNIYKFEIIIFFVLSPLSPPPPLSLCCVSPCTSASVLQETRLPKRTTFASMDIFGSPPVSSDIYA